MSSNRAGNNTQSSLGVSSSGETNRLHDVLSRLEHPQKATAPAASFGVLAQAIVGKPKKKRQRLLPGPKDLKENAIAAKEDQQEKDALQTTLANYAKARQACLEEMARKKAHVETQKKAIQECRNMYLFGLEEVSKLQDLREAPDAILPGNFVTQGDE